MKNFKPQTAAHVALFLVVGALVVSLAWPLAGVAQDKTPDPAKHKHADKSVDADKDLAAQVRELQAKVARLEAALQKSGQGMSSGMAGQKQGMGGMMGMDGMMGGMGGKKQGMGGMSGSGMGGMMDMDMKKGGGMGGMGMEDDDMDMMGMMGMGSMGGGSKGMGKMKMAAALPGFPGASHIYHIGATGFFLDHPEHITLSTQQQTQLNRVKQKALTDKASAQRKIDETEQELWQLTASDEPDATKIEAQVRVIEKLRSDQRLAVIRAVGESAKVLTDEQRQILLGTAKADAHKQHAPPAK
jgi:Spy/CpxP family protein refolding chaperone